MAKQMKKFTASFANGKVVEKASSLPIGFAWLVEWTWEGLGQPVEMWGFSATRENAEKALAASMAKYSEQKNFIFSGVVATE